MEALRPARLLPDAHARPPDRIVRRCIHPDAVCSRLLIRHPQSAKIAVRQIPQRGMLEDVVAIPFDHRPVELLPPATRHPKPVLARLAQSRHRGRLLEVALQVPIGPQLSKLLRHHNRIITVRSAPGSVRPTATTPIVTFDRASSGRSAFPSVASDTVMP